MQDGSAAALIAIRDFFNEDKIQARIKQKSEEDLKDVVKSHKDLSHFIKPENPYREY